MTWASAVVMVLAVLNARVVGLTRRCVHRDRIVQFLRGAELPLRYVTATECLDKGSAKYYQLQKLDIQNGHRDSVLNCGVFLYVIVLIIFDDSVQMSYNLFRQANSGSVTSRDIDSPAFCRAGLSTNTTL